MNNLFGRLVHYIYSHNKMWKTTVSTLTVMIVFSTTCALILPAITLDSEVASEEPGVYVERDGGIYDEENDPDYYEEPSHDDTFVEPDEGLNDVWTDPADNTETADPAWADAADSAADTWTEPEDSYGDADIVPETEPIEYAELSADNAGIHALMTFKAPALFPQNTQLSITELTRFDDAVRFDEYVNLVNAELSARVQQPANDVRLFALSVGDNVGAIAPDVMSRVRLTFDNYEYAAADLTPYVFGFHPEGADELAEVTCLVNGTETWSTLDGDAVSGYVWSQEYYDYEVIAVGLMNEEQWQETESFFEDMTVGPNEETEAVFEEAESNVGSFAEETTESEFAAESDVESFAEETTESEFAAESDVESFAEEITEKKPVDESEKESAVTSVTEEISEPEYAAESIVEEVPEPESVSESVEEMVEPESAAESAEEIAEPESSVESVVEDVIDPESVAESNVEVVAEPAAPIIGVADTRIVTVSGADYVLRVSYGDEAGIPANAQIIATPVESKAYEEKALEAVNDSIEGEEDHSEKLNMVGLVDLTIYVDGKVIAPTGPVQVSVEFPEKLATNERIYAVHFPGTGEQPEETEDSAFEASEPTVDTADNSEVVDSTAGFETAEPEVLPTAEDIFAIRRPMKKAAKFIAPAMVEEAAVVPESDTAPQIDVAEDSGTESAFAVEPAPDVMEARVSGESAAFVLDGLSYIAIVSYTVDFTYEGRTWSFPGQGSYRLTDVLAVLGIEGNVEDADLTLIKGEDHAGALYLTQADGEYYINSDIAFADTYELRVRVEEKIYIITVTDTQESADLSDFLQNAVVTGATQDSDGKYHVESGKEYSIILTFAEGSAYQFDNTGTLSYQIPVGIEILSKQESDGNINIVYKGRTYQVGFHYVLDTDGSLKINFDTNDPDFPRLEESTNVSFRFTYTGEFDGSKTTIKFNDVIERDITFDEPEPGQAYVSKNGTFDETTGTYHYTVKVTASGDVTDVRVKDVISGNVLIVNNDVQVTGNSSSYTDHGATNGFDYTFASMQEGEEITINYSAKIDPSKIPANGKVTTDMTRNTVIVTPDDGPPHNASYSHEINLKKPDKSTGVESGTTADGKKLYKWTIDYNTLALAKAGGDTVSDSIGESSRQYMKYHGDVVVKVYDHSGNLVGTRSFTPSTDYTWTYIVPDTDTTPYRYVFEYETEVDQAAIDLTGSSVKLNNDSEGPGGKDSEGITVVPKESTSITKEVVSSDEQEITWISHIHVPESGLSKAVVTDTLPYIHSNNLGLSGNYMLYDKYKEGTLEIIGILEGESYNVAHYIDPNDSHDKIVITFYKDINKTTEGLKGGTPGGRDITVKLTTKVNQDWLNAGYNYPTSYQSFHTNNININGGEDVQAQVKYLEPGIKKTGYKSGKQYKYTIYVTHVDSSPIIINDIFDRSVLEVDTSLDGHDWNYQSMYITGGDYPGHVYSGDTSVKVDYSDTTDGIQITANNVPLQDNGQYYPTYMITYFLKLKEGVDLEQLAIANGGEYDLTNKALWGDYESEFSFKTTYDYLDKQLLNGGELGETNRKAQYRITFNSAKATLNQGEPMVMTDVMSANLSVDYSSIRIVTYPTGQEVPYSLSGEKDEYDLPTGRTIATYTVPDSTMVVITYDADVRGNGSQTIVNKVSVNDEDETITTTKSYGTVTEGEGAIASFKIVKVDGYDANKKLKGVRFKIFAENPELSFKKSEVLKELILTTDENGEINLDGKEYDFYFNEVYHIQEIEPLDDYGTISFDYLVTLTKDMANVDYPHYIYYYNDSMQIKNWPLEGLVVEKQVESPDNSDKEKYYPFRISILKDDGTVNTSYNEKNGDDQFVNGVFEFKLKDKEQKMFWGFKKGTKYKVEEIDNNGMITSVTYKVFDEDGNVTETKTESGLSHIGTLTQENEIITFKNSKTEQKGALKFTKAVKVNGEDTTTTAANGEYTFTVKGPGTTETVSKTVVIKVENGVATKYKIDDATTFTDLPADKFVVISDLTPGEYTITETSSTNTNMTLASINGGKDGTANVQNKQVTVTVTAGETIEAAATATFTNNLPTTEVEVNKTWLVGTTDYSGMLSPMFGSVTVELGVVKVATNATDEEIKAAEIVKDILGNDAKATMSAPTWSATVSNLPVLESGYKYAVKELSVKSGDTDISSYFDTTLSGTTVNNAPKLTEVIVNKQWKPTIPENTTITLGLYSGKTEDAAAATTPVTTIVLDGTADSTAENISSADTKAGTKQETSGWTAEFRNLPKYAYDTEDGVYEIKYVVKETNAPEGYTVSYGGDGAYVITGGTITNTKNPGDLELTKKVAGDGADTSKEFEFTIELTAPAGETLAESYTFKKGDAEATGITYTRNGTATETESANSTATVTGIKLKADETFTIVGLPAGTTYKITETDYSAAGYSSSIPGDGKTGTITGGTTAKESVEVTNTLSAGDLTVEKTLGGNATNSNKEFNFKVIFEKAGLTGNNGTYKIGTLETIASVDATNITFTEGKAEISYKLKGGQKAVFSNLPDGTKFTVEEISKDADGYETTVSSTGGTVNADKTVTGSISSTAAVTVSYVNTKDTIPVEAAKAWKSGGTAIAWPEDVESVEFKLYKTVNSQTTVVVADDLTNYWEDTRTFTNPITVSSSIEGKKASWADLPKRMLVTTTETADGQEVTTSAWYDVTYSVKETKVTFTAASGKETLKTEEAIQAAYNPTSWDATDKTITNNVPKITIEGTKTWNVLGSSIPTVNPTLTLTRISSKEGADPETVTPAEGQPVWSDVEGQTNVKKYQFTELDKYDTDGYLYTYSVTEASFKVGDVTYTVTKNGDTYTVKVGETEVKTFTVTQEGYNITNTETKDFEFTKIWRDISQQDVEWPEGKQITVTFNASVEGKEKALEDQRLTFSPGTCPKGWTKETSADGKKTTFKISGLAAKDADGKELTYYVVEETVEGYNEPIYAFDTNGTITIKPDSGPTKDKAVNRDYIINTPEGGYELPQTGGPGTRLFTILGSILILGAGVLLWRRRKLI